LPASNLYGGDNPEYTKDTFLSYYPQFAGVPDVFLTMYLNLAHATVKYSRWDDMWLMAMGLFVAHFCTLYLQSAASATSTAAQIVAAGEARGLTTSKSVGDVSKSTDYNTIAQGLNSWAMWLSTTFGQQYATFAKLVCKGGMYVG
jgi:hypothetical protein